MLLSGNKPTGKPAPEKPRPQFEHLEPRIATPIGLTTLDKMRELRAKKVLNILTLQSEIASIDRDVAWLETHPGSAEILETIAKRLLVDFTHKEI